MVDLQLNSTYVTETCCSCGIHFAIPRDFYQQRRNDHKSFFCPDGHSQYYSGKSNEEKLKDELAAAEKKINFLNERANSCFENMLAEKRSKAAHKAHFTILKQKIKKGQCPCCKKSFRDVADHIKTSHPDYNNKMKVKSK